MKQLLVATLGREIHRRALLGKIGAVAAGGALAMLGVRAASATNYYCCTLCNAPGTCSGCTCSWCWGCCDQTFHVQYACCECFGPGGACSGDTCFNVYCSYVLNFGPC